MKKEEIIEVLEDRFKDRYELNYTNQEAYSLILHYPEVKLSNSENKSHTIRNLFVKLAKTSDEYRCHLYGLRATVTKQEYGSGYSHSHLEASNIGIWKEFCLGISELSELLRENFFKSKEHFEYFLEVLWSYLSWESIEGNPYIKLSTISGFQQLEVRDFTRDNQDFVRQIPINFSRIATNLNFKIRNIREIETELVSYLDEKCSYFVVNKIGDKYFSRKGNDLPSSLPRVLIFNGESIYLTILRNNNDNNKPCKTAHPELTKALSDRIQGEIRKFYLRNYTVGTRVSS